ncbi:MAG: capsular biosynthesis protein [Fimbriimonadaceae bacterium]|nr:capsular biosynthesis protein [Fimbriimonadaceae bacterium]
MNSNDRKRIVIDVDGTLAQIKAEGQDYADLEPNAAVLETLVNYREQGFYIVVYSSRNMRTYQNNLGLLQANTLPKLIDWLDTHRVPYDEVHIGKPWCGFAGFYVDDKAIRPDEFASLTYEEILRLVGGEGG